MPGIRGLNAAINLAGVPALALPVAATGPARTPEQSRRTPERSRRTPLPASVQLIGPAGSEEALLAAGALLEQATQV
jgi:Asp-tRNA(Asn)/Glu-tRNA(Gln) amidotransferase A subunit family amidase